jgi:DNA-binding response OmpR family regulator
MATRSWPTPLVLLVNDELDERRRYARSLRASGYRAIEARNFNAAHRIAIAHHVDVVVTDLQVAGVTGGHHWTRRLRNDSRTSTLPIIMLGAVSRRRESDLAIAAGVDRLLEKPVSSRVLEEAIVQLLTVFYPQRRHPGTSVCPACGAPVEYRGRWPILIAADTDGRDRLGYRAGWFCTNVCCNYGESR